MCKSVNLQKRNSEKTEIIFNTSSNFCALLFKGILKKKSFKTIVSKDLILKHPIIETKINISAPVADIRQAPPPFLHHSRLNFPTKSYFLQTTCITT